MAKFQAALDLSGNAARITVADENGFVQAVKGNTEIFLYPPYKFKCVDGCITNFHLPMSTLIMLISCFSSREKTLAFYNEAVKERYRFFSFGDACLIL
jgi:S-adenosylmethionine:tRNA ribosyltransferase-isomerase